MKIWLVLLFACTFGATTIYSFTEDKEYEKGPTGGYCMEKMCDDCYSTQGGLNNELFAYAFNVEECQIACMDITGCKGIMFGTEGDVKDECRLLYPWNFGKSTKFKKSGKFQGWEKKTDCDDGAQHREYCMMKMCDDCQDAGATSRKLIPLDMSSNACLESCMNELDCLGVEIGVNSKAGKCWHLERGYAYQFGRSNWKDIQVWDKANDIQCGGTGGEVPENVGNEYCMLHLCDDCWMGATIREKIPLSLSIEDCQKHCLEEPFCTAIEYKVEEQECELLGGREKSYREDRSYREGITVYIRTDEQTCAAEGVTEPSQMYCMAEVCTNCYLERSDTNPKAIAVRGQMTLGQCKSTCLIDDHCTGIDFGKELNDANNNPHGDALNRCYILYSKRLQGKDLYYREGHDNWVGSYGYQKMPDEDGKCISKNAASNPTPEAECEAQKYLDMGYTCAQLEGAGWNMGPCTCPVVTCASEVLMKQGYSCEQLVAAGHDVTGCGCEDTCQYVCQQYIDQGFSCQECELAGLECTPCDECGGCACKKYIDQGYTCSAIEKAGLDCSNCSQCDSCECQEFIDQGITCAEIEAKGYDCSNCDCDAVDPCKCTQYLEQGWSCNQIEAAGLDCSGCDCGSCAAQAYVNMGMDCVHMKQAGLDVTGCGCDDVCACQEYLDQANLGYTCELLESHGMDCSGCECSAVCTDSCNAALAQGLTCKQLKETYGMDCSACDCTPKCTDTCKQYLTHYSCRKMMEGFTIDCSGCSECSCAQCGAYVPHYQCDDLESSYGMDCSDCTTC